jgi:hypothetical protein
MSSADSYFLKIVKKKIKRTTHPPSTSHPIETARAPNT